MAMDPDELTRRVEELQKKTVDLEGQIKKVRDEGRDREVKRLRWGVAVLGTVVMGIASWALSEVKHLVSLSVGKSP